MKIYKKDRFCFSISEARERDINMIGQPGEQQIVGLDHENKTAIAQG